MSDEGEDVAAFEEVTEDVELGEDRDFGDVQNEFTEVSYENIGSRLKDSFQGICFGFLLFFGAFPLLYWNEGRAVERYDTLNEGAALTKTVDPFSLSASNDYSLVHFTAMVSSKGENLTDPLFGVTSTDLKLHRDVEMYQWRETTSSKTTTQVGGGEKTEKTYTYNKVWSSSLISSSNFKYPTGHTNPSSMKYNDWTGTQNTMYAGSFTLPPDIVGRINWYSTLSPVNKTDIPDQTLRNNADELSSKDGFFIGTGTNTAPKVGDTRVDFTSVKPQTISVVAMQVGDTLAQYEAEAGGSVLLFERGNLTAEEMYAKAEAANAAVTWFLRFLGYFVMAFGIYSVLYPIEVIADIIPIVGDIVGCGLKYIAGTVAGILSGITISIAWLIHHPKIGIIVLVCITAFTVAIGYCVKHLQNNDDEEEEPPKDDPVEEEEPVKEDPEQPIEEEETEEEIKVEQEEEAENEAEIKVEA